jgi:hypothetical protein
MGHTQVVRIGQEMQRLSDEEVHDVARKVWHALNKYLFTR